PGSATTRPSARAARVPSSRDFGLRSRLRAPPLDEPDRAGRGLFDREVGDLDHGAAEPALDRFRLLELGVDLEQLGVGALVPAEPGRALAPDLLEAHGVDGEPDDLRRV